MERQSLSVVVSTSNPSDPSKPATAPSSPLLDSLAQWSSRVMSPSTSAAPSAAPAETEAAPSPVVDAPAADAPAAAESAPAPALEPTDVSDPPAATSDPADDPDAASHIGEDCAICFEAMTEPRQWPAKCGHYFCDRCVSGCLNRSLKCPMCRTMAPHSARPAGDRRRIILSVAQRIRVEELERLRLEHEANRRPRREPRTRAGRWLRDRYRGANQWVDSVLGID